MEAMPAASASLVQFEGFEIDLANWQVRYGQEVLSLNRKTFDLLLYLAERADRVVTKDELLRGLWPEAFIEESNLTQQVFMLRKALARYQPEIKFIVTVPGRGYRFAVPVQFVARQEVQPRTQSFVATPGELVEDPRDRAGAIAAGENGSHSHRGLVEGSSTVPAKDAVARPADRRAVYSAIAVALTASLCLFALLLRSRERDRVVVAGYTQITHDGHAKSIGGTDGNRIYFTRLEKSSLAEVPVSGGTEAMLPLAVQDPWAGEVSPDGSKLLIISQAGGQGPAASLWSLELVGGRLHRLGNAISSTWSPDGRQIVYASANGELFAMRSDGADAHRIATVGGYVSSIAWSPDGHTLRFTRDGVLWQIGSDGSNLRELLPLWGKSPSQESGRWAADGTYYFVADGQIWRLEETASLPWRGKPSPVQLTSGPTIWDRPTPTPDGQRILASGRTQRGELVRFEPGSAVPKVFLGGVSAEFVTFSHAANAVAYVSFPEGVLWRSGPDGSNPVRLTEPPVYPKSICWSPDGSQIAFVDRAADKVAAIFTVPSDGKGKPHRLLPADSEAENDPSWSPDGSKLAFSTSPNVGASGKSDLRVFEFATGQTSVLPGSEGLMVPRWSADGRFLSAMTLDARSLKLLNVATGQWSVLDTGAVAFPEWSHDGQWIYYVRWTADPAIVRIHVPDGRREDLTRLVDARYTGVYTLWMGLDPEDRPLMLRDAGTDDIYALTLKRN
jgi:Tol biopolymer transport system component/DNA-binding winged helix-turn-helix (wHTH) protein